MVDRFNIKLYMSLTLTNISHKLEKVSRSSVQSLNKTLVLCFTYVFNLYDIYGMVWSTQIELVLVISVQRLL